MKTRQCVKLIIVCLVMCCFPFGLPPAGAATYNFTNIVDSGGILSAFDVPAINNHGEVAYFARFDEGGRGIFKSDGVLTTTIADTITSPTPEGAFTALNPEPAINDHGTVAFLGEFDTVINPLQRGVFTRGGPEVSFAIADTSDQFFTFNRIAGINNSGTVAFHALLDSPPGSHGVFTGNGASGLNNATTIASNNVAQFGAIGTRPSINNSGLVAFQAELSGTHGGIYVGDGLSTTTIADSLDTNGQFLGFGTSVSVNESGTVAFLAALRGDSRQAVVTGSGGPTTIVADSSGPFDVFGTVPTINDAGTVAFLAELDSGEQGIFTGPHAIDDKVIQTGDSLFGHSVTDLDFLRGLNNLGQIAFAYELSNGQQGIAIASPDTVPIPVQRYRLDVIYSQEGVVSGPISFGLGDLPATAEASFDLVAPVGTTTLTIDHVVSATVSFGDGTWTELETFTLQRDPFTGEILGLDYRFSAIDTQTVLMGITVNFPLTITGMDRASGESFEYRYAASEQTLTVVPEPSSLVMVFASGLIAAATRKRTRAPRVGRGL